MSDFLKNRLPFLIPYLKPISEKIKNRRYKSMTTEEIFLEIYQKNKWGDMETRSGFGSSLKQTKEIRKRLPTILKNYKISSMLDIPCGDLNWMKTVDLRDVRYLGADVVSDIIKINKKKFVNSSYSFLHMDILKDQLPEVDLIFCRDLLIHFSYDDTLTAISNIKKSKSKYFLTTSYMGTLKNYNITTGNWHPKNLQIDPFNFPKPLEIIDEKGTTGKETGRSMLMFDNA